MVAPSAALFVNKLAAARRLLQSAIRLFCAREDQLAIHVVASSSYSILSEIKRTRGQDEAQLAAETQVRGLIQMAQQYLDGTLPASAHEDSYTMEMLQKLGAILKSGKTVAELCANLEIAIDAQYSNSFHRKRTQAFNFLKHGNEGPAALLDEEKIDNFSLLLGAMTSYESVAPDDLGLEGAALAALLLAMLETSLENGHPLKSIVDTLREMDPAERLAFFDTKFREPRVEAAGSGAA